jgi:acyl-CoA reductase-like NAD-dependent aldehyde dehydrogenase
MTTIVDNFINGKFVPPKITSYAEVVSPINSEIIGKVALSTKKDVEIAVENAKKAFVSWSNMTVKTRAGIMLKLHGLIRDHAGIIYLFFISIIST